MAELTYRDAVARGIAQEMERDEDVVFLGEDVAGAGGVFKATVGLLEKWKQRDPIKIYRERLAQFGISDKVIGDIDAEVRKMVDDATEACKAAPMPPMDILTTDVYADGGFAWRN